LSTRRALSNRGTRAARRAQRQNQRQQQTPKQVKYTEPTGKLDKFLNLVKKKNSKNSKIVQNQ